MFFLSSPALSPESWRTDHSDYVTHFPRLHLCACAVAPTSRHRGQHVEVMGTVLLSQLSPSVVGSGTEISSPGLYSRCLYCRASLLPLST